MNQYSVTVGNLGEVFRGSDFKQAQEFLVEYSKQARCGRGRADFPVVFWDGEEPVTEVEE